MRNRRAPPVGRMGAWREFLVPSAIATHSRGGARILRDARFGGGMVLRWLRQRFGGGAVAEARAATRLAQSRLRDAVEAIPEGVVFLDAEGRYILWNRRYAEIYHRSADLFREGASLMDTLRIGVARGDYPDALGREEAWLAARAAKLATATGERHEQQVAD